jgi:hypothetical protein
VFVAGIFICFSESAYVEKVAQELKDLLNSVYKGQNFDVFFSPGTTSEALSTRKKYLKDSKCGIVLLTADDFKSDRLQYETAFLTSQWSKISGLRSRQNLYLILVDRKENQIEETIKDYQRIKIEDKGQMMLLLQSFGNSFKLDFNSETYDTEWEKFLEGLTSLRKDRTTLLIVDKQAYIYIAKDTLRALMDGEKPKKLTARKLTELLDNYAKLFDKDYKREPEPENPDYGISIWINKTRFSTFFCFTDKRNVLLFNRHKDGAKPFTTHDNKRYDVFGSQEFGNKPSITKKIKNDKFWDCRIRNIFPIPGLAYEDNVGQGPSERKTVVMIGFIIVMGSRALKLACKDKDKFVTSHPINNNKLSENQLTSKASLAMEGLRGTFGRDFNQTIFETGPQWIKVTKILLGVIFSGLMLIGTWAAVVVPKPLWPEIKSFYCRIAPNAEMCTPQQGEQTGSH